MSCLCACACVCMCMCVCVCVHMGTSTLCCSHPPDHGGAQRAHTQVRRTTCALKPLQPKVEGRGPARHPTIAVPSGVHGHLPTTAGGSARRPPRALMAAAMKKTAPPNKVGALPGPRGRLWVTPPPLTISCDTAFRHPSASHKSIASV